MYIYGVVVIVQVDITAVSFEFLFFFVTILPADTPLIESTEKGVNTMIESEYQGSMA